MITVIHEHSVDLSLLPPQALILDAGCRGMDFTNHFRALGHKVLAIDIDKFEGEYLQVGISSEYKDAYISQDSDLQARHITDRGTEQIECVPLSKLEFIVGGKFDLIKLDVEGEEYNIIMSLTEPPAKQISVEMHIHTGIYGMKEAKEMENKLLSLGYYAATHELSERHGAGLNFWDSLFILK